MMQYNYDGYPNYNSPDVNNYDQQYPYDQPQQDEYFRHHHHHHHDRLDGPIHGDGVGTGGPPPQPPMRSSYHQQYADHQQPPQQQYFSSQQDFDRNPSVRSPTYHSSGGHPDAAQIAEAQNKQRAMLATLPHVDLPPYELPPPYIPKSEVSSVQ